MIHLYSPGTGELYGGLLSHLKEWCRERQYAIQYEDNDWYGEVEVENDFVSPPAVADYMKNICKYKPRDYQYMTVYKALKNNRGLFLSPTGSGKSLMIYSIVRYYVASGKKILLIVPTTSLVEQMIKDFKDYGWAAEEFCHTIYSGKDKNTDKPVVISTWQSIYKFPKDTLMTLIVLSEMRHTYLKRSPSQVSSPNSTTRSIASGSLVHLTAARLISGSWRVCLVRVNRLRRRIRLLRKVIYRTYALKF